MNNEKEFFEILSALHRNGVLKHLVLIGSCALEVYKHNFGSKEFELVTKDIDFLVKNPRGPFPKNIISIHNILQEKGYKAERSTFSNYEKYIPDKSVSDKELDIEFLCQPGRIVKDAYPIKELGITAQSIQYQYILLDDIITMDYKGVEVDVPDPTVLAIHKVAISQLRAGSQKEWKIANDLNIAKVLVDSIGEEKILKKAEQYKGEFLKLFEKGWEIFQNEFKDFPFNYEKNG